jgi:hypothetical protein
MGGYETGAGNTWWLAIQRLAKMAKSFPGLSFNLAIEWPCISKENDPQNEQFQAAFQAARVLDPNAPLCGSWTGHRLIPPGRQKDRFRK